MNKQLLDFLSRGRAMALMLAIALPLGVWSCLAGWDRMERQANDFMMACDGELQECRNACVVDHLQTGRNNATVRHCLNWEPDQ